MEWWYCLLCLDSPFLPRSIWLLQFRSKESKIKLWTCFRHSWVSNSLRLYGPYHKKTCLCSPTDRGTVLPLVLFSIVGTISISVSGNPRVFRSLMYAGKALFRQHMCRLIWAITGSAYRKTGFLGMLLK